MPLTSLDIENIFTYHAPQPGQVEKYKELRDKAKDLAYLIIRETPSCAEQTLAVRKLEEAIFYANASIARHG